MCNALITDLDLEGSLCQPKAICFQKLAESNQNIVCFLATSCNLKRCMFLNRNDVIDRCWGGFSCILLLMC